MGTHMDIDNWRTFKRDELTDDGYLFGAPPRRDADAEEIYQTDIRIVEADPCPACGGKIVYQGFRKPYTSQYGLLSRGFHYRAFGVCQSCNEAFEY